MIDTDAPFFSKDPFSLNFGRGSATVQYRPIAFDGTLTPTELSFGMGWGPDQPVPATAESDHAACRPIPPRCTDTTTPECSQMNWDGMPEVEFFDLAAGDWVRLPHLAAGLPLHRRRAGPLRRPRDRARSWSASSTIGATA